RKAQLALDPRTVESLARGCWPVAEGGIARPQVDARGARLVGIVLAGRRRVLGPAPGPDAVELHLLRHLLRGEGLQLHRLEPRIGRLQPFAPAGPLRRLEAQEDPELRGGNPELSEVE